MLSNFDSMTNMNYLVCICNVFVDTLPLLIVCAWKMYDMQTLHAGGIPMFRGAYLVCHSTYSILTPISGFVQSTMIQLVTW